MQIPPGSDQRSIVPKREPDLQPIIQSAASQQPQQPSQQPQQSAQQQTPSTSQNTRRETSNLVIACRQCRARKIRCDSTRPICHNCVRRSNECQYDAVPKRRGPDKRPGTRQRSCKKRPAEGSAPPIPPPKRKKAVAPSGEAQSSPQSQRLSSEQDDRAHLGQPSLSSQRSELPSSAQSTTLSNSYPASDKPCVSSVSTMQYDPKESWNNLLDRYSNTREQSMRDITNDLSVVFTTPGYWLPLINVNEFVRQLYGSGDPSLPQLSLVFAGLAVATLMKSSEMGLGTAGRNRAAWFRDTAQSSLEASWSAQLIDINLAKAALMLAIYESSAHHLYTPEREKKALGDLDLIIRTLGFTFTDSNEPDVSTFTPNTVPVARRRTFGNTPKDSIRSSPIAHKCSCVSFSSNSSVMSDQCSPFWTFFPPYNNSLWTSEEADKEDRRRLCWSALSLVASYTSRCLTFRKEPAELFMTDPSNFRLLFPGEVSERGSPEHKPQSPKDSIWALYCRSMLLWNFCVIHLRKNSFASEETSELALQAWRETQEMQDALDLHTCNLDMVLLYMCREYVYSTQMVITSILQSIHGPDAGQLPSFSRKHSEQWLYHLGYFISRVRLSVERLADGRSDSFNRRPFQLTWFASQISICLSLWENDRSLIEALEVAKDILVPVELLNTLWPCPVLQSKCDDLRKKVTETCHAINIPPPSSSNSSFSPPHGRGGG